MTMKIIPLSWYRCPKIGVLAHILSEVLKFSCPGRLKFGLALVSIFQNDIFPHFIFRVSVFLGFGSVLELVLELGLVLQIGIGLFASKKISDISLVDGN